MRLQGEFLLPESEARSFAEQFRPHLAAPVDPALLHGSAVFEKLDDLTRRQDGHRRLRRTLNVMLICLNTPGGYALDRTTRPIGL